MGFNTLITNQTTRKRRVLVVFGVAFNWLLCIAWAFLPPICHQLDVSIREAWYDLLVYCVIGLPAVSNIILNGTNMVIVYGMKKEDKECTRKAECYAQWAKITALIAGIQVCAGMKKKGISP